MMKCAIYARVSTLDKGQDPELQLRPMREYCERMSLSFDEFVDYASGVKQSRPSLDEMMKKMKNKEYDMLIVWRLSRLTRSLEQLIDIVYNELRPRNIAFKCITQDIDTTTATGRLALNVMGAFDEFEHDIISENVTEGMALAKNNGKPIGRKRALSDLTISAVMDYGKTHSIRATARAFGIPAGTAHNYLSGRVSQKVEKIDE